MESVRHIHNLCDLHRGSHSLPSLVWRKGKVFRSWTWDGISTRRRRALDSFFLHRRTSSANENSPDFISRKVCVSQPKKKNEISSIKRSQCRHQIASRWLLIIQISTESKILNKKFAMSLCTLSSHHQVADVELCNYLSSESQFIQCTFSCGSYINICTNSH